MITIIIVIHDFVNHFHRNLSFRIVWLVERCMWFSITIPMLDDMALQPDNDGSRLALQPACTNEPHGCSCFYNKTSSSIGENRKRSWILNKHILSQVSPVCCILRDSSQRRRVRWFACAYCHAGPRQHGISSECRIARYTICRHSLQASTSYLI